MRNGEWASLSPHFSSDVGAVVVPLDRFHAPTINAWLTSSSSSSSSSSLGKRIRTSIHPMEPIQQKTTSTAVAVAVAAAGVGEESSTGQQPPIPTTKLVETSSPLLTPRQLDTVNASFFDLFGYTWSSTTTSVDFLSKKCLPQQQTTTATTAERDDTVEDDDDFYDRDLLTEMLGPTAAARILYWQSLESTTIATADGSRRTRPKRKRIREFAPRMQRIIPHMGPIRQGTAASFVLGRASVIPPLPNAITNTFNPATIPLVSDNNDKGSTPAVETRALEPVAARTNPTSGSSSSNSNPPARSTSTSAAATGSSSSTSGGGVDGLLFQLKHGNQKLSTVAKTSADWDAFKQDSKDATLQQRLEEQAESSTSFLHRQEFIQRVDHRKFDLEKQERASSR